MQIQRRRLWPSPLLFASGSMWGELIMGTLPTSARTSYNGAISTLVTPAYRACFGQDFLLTALTLTHGNRRGAPSRIRVGSLSSIPAMACVSRNRAGVPVIAGYHYIRRVRFSRRARIPNVVAHHGRHVGSFRSLCCGGGLCVGSFYAAPACLSKPHSASAPVNGANALLSQPMQPL